MGFLDSIRNFGSKVFSKVKEGVSKVIPIVKKFAPIIGRIAGAIPHPAAQTISAIARGAESLASKAGEMLS